MMFVVTITGKGGPSSNPNHYCDYEVGLYDRYKWRDMGPLEITSDWGYITAIAGGANNPT